MADRVVIDASVALAFLRTESGTAAATAAIDEWRAGDAELFVPAHFWLEVTNIIVGRRSIAPEQAVAALIDLDGLALKTIEADRPLLLLAIEQMARSGLSAYDAIYLALALATDSRLATLDRRLAEAAGDAGMLVGSGGSGRISEVPSNYVADLDPFSGWAHSAVVGAHIAELRRQALADT